MLNGEGDRRSSFVFYSFYRITDEFESKWQFELGPHLQKWSCSFGRHSSTPNEKLIDLHGRQMFPVRVNPKLSVQIRNCSFHFRNPPYGSLLLLLSLVITRFAPLLLVLANCCVSNRVGFHTTLACNSSSMTSYSRIRPDAHVKHKRPNWKLRDTQIERN